jgi:deazaflavin-dependent oxidoreductase (nitroreductase family)
MLYGKEHVDRYVATNGEEGFTWRNGTEILVLTTTGRKTGDERSNALIFGRHGDDLLVVGSKGGSPAPPQW